MKQAMRVVKLINSDIMYIDRLASDKCNVETISAVSLRYGVLHRGSVFFYANFYKEAFLDETAI